MTQVWIHYLISKLENINFTWQGQVYYELKVFFYYIQLHKSTQKSSYKITNKNISSRLSHNMVVLLMHLL